MAVGRFVTGFRAPLEGSSYILKNPSLWPLAIFPFALNLILIVGAFYWAFNNLANVVISVLAFIGLNDLTGFFAWVVVYFAKILFWLFFLMFLFFAAYVVGQILAAPFSSLLSERALIKLEVIPNRPFSFGDWVKNTLRMLKVSILKSILFLALGLLFLIVGLIPVVNIISSLGVLLIMVFDSLDYSFENMRMNLGERLTYFKSHLAMFSGFAVALGVILLVPGLNFFLFPSSVVGAAILIKKIKEEKVGT